MTRLLLVNAVIASITIFASCGCGKERNGIPPQVVEVQQDNTPRNTLPNNPDEPEQNKPIVTANGDPYRQEKLSSKKHELIYFTNSIGMKFVWIPPGTFLMGSPKEENERDVWETQHMVTLTKGFYMSVYLVTQEIWQKIMENNPSAFKGEINLPVETISWNDCQEFIKKLREKDKMAYRLPTEAEWEYACRAGTKTPFHFGKTISTEQANFNGNLTYGNGVKGVNRKKTMAVGSFPANAFGLHDMHGNLWQWCQDWGWYEDYPQNDVVDPQGPEKRERPDKREGHVLRGGAWDCDPRYCRSAIRGWAEPYYRDYAFGFRICFYME